MFKALRYVAALISDHPVIALNIIDCIDSIHRSDRQRLYPCCSYRENRFCAFRAERICYGVPTVSPRSFTLPVRNDKRSSERSGQCGYLASCIASAVTAVVYSQLYFIIIVNVIIAYLTVFTRAVVITVDSAPVRNIKHGLYRRHAY